MFGRRQPFYPILRALLDGRLTLVLSTEILLEYEEVTVKLASRQRWQDAMTLLEILAQLHGNIRHIEPQYRFGIITADPDDNKFCDCAIAAEADFVTRPSAVSQHQTANCHGYSSPILQRAATPGQSGESSPRCRSA